MTVKEFLRPFLFTPYSVNFYEDGSLVNGASISEISDWIVDHVRNFYFKVYEPSIGEKDLGYLKLRKYELVLELEVRRKELENG